MSEAAEANGEGGHRRGFRLSRPVEPGSGCPGRAATARALLRTSKRELSGDRRAGERAIPCRERSKVRR
jgi:hypothetical protein